MIALDIGTTHSKAFALNRQGRVVQQAATRNHILDKLPGIMEQAPGAIWQNVQDLLDALCTLRPERLILSSAMHGFMACGENGLPLTNFWLWSDLRADALAQAFRKTAAGEAYYRRMGVPVHAMSPAMKWKWARENREMWVNACSRIYDIKSWLWFQLTGEYAIDMACASASGLMNVHSATWDSEFLLENGLSADQLPLIVSPKHSAPLRPELARRWGNITCMIGTSDGAAASLALPAGTHTHANASLTIGTSAALRLLTDKPVLDAQMRTFCYRIDNQQFIVGGASNNGANVLEWMQQNLFGGQMALPQLLALAEQSPPGACGLLFLPYIYGERAPLYRGDVSGGFAGLQSKHTQADLVRAVMEGILLNLRLIAEGIRAQLPFGRILLGGGFAQNRVGVQLLANILQVPVHCLEEGMDQSVAGLLRWSGDYLEVEVQTLFAGAQFEPDAALNAVYENVYRHFTEEVKGL